MNLIHPVTEQHIRRLVRSTDLPLLISGSDVRGRLSVLSKVEELIGDKLQLITLRYDATDDFGIEQIRELWTELSKKLPDGQTRLIVLDNSHNLRIEAQNALLKTLEESPRRTLIVLSTDRADSLLPTIRSRMRLLQVLSPSLEQYRSEFPSVAADSLERNYKLSDGYPGLMSLLHDNSEAGEVNIQLAKDILQMSTFQRLAYIDILAKDKEIDVENVLNDLLRVCRGAAQHVAAQQQLGLSAWVERSERVLKAIQDVRSYGNQKIVLTDLFLTL